MSILTMLANAFLLSIAVAIDLMVCGIAYGINKTDTSLSKVTVVITVNSVLFGISLFVGYLAGQYISGVFTMFLSMSILCSLGLFKIFQMFFKKNKDLSSHPFSFREALALGIGVALDAMAAGFGAGVNSGKNILFCLVIFIVALVIHIVLFFVGKFIGHKISNCSHFGFNWASGIILIGLGISKIL